MPRLPVTTGDSYTVAIAVQAIREAARVMEISALAAKHGFQLSGFRSFEREVTQEQIERVRQRANRQGQSR